MAKILRGEKMPEDVLLAKEKLRTMSATAATDAQKVAVLWAEFEHRVLRKNI